MKQIGKFESSAWGSVVAFKAIYGGATGPVAVVLRSPDGEPLAKLSVNMYRPECSADSRDLPPDCFYAKTWGENGWVIADALASGLFRVREDLPKALSGFVEVPVWQVVGSAG